LVKVVNQTPIQAHILHKAAALHAQLLIPDLKSIEVLIKVSAGANMKPNKQQSASAGVFMEVVA
jgi:hypothetical protein